MDQIKARGAASPIEVRLMGLMSRAGIAACAGDMRQAVIAFCLREYAMIVDLTDRPIQPHTNIAAMVENMAKMPRARAIAIVMGSSPVRIQARRLFAQRHARITDTLAKGRVWALEGTEPTAP